MKRDVVVDMTKGKIAPQILKFAMPVLLGLIFQRIYNFADSWIVGHFLGDNALAAVSVAGVGMYLVFSLIIGLTTGVTVVMSQYYGAKQEEKVVETFFSSIYIALGMTVIVTVAGTLLSRPLLILLQTPEEVLAEAVWYLQIICLGSVGTMLYNWISAVLRSLGNSIVPLVFLGISSALNVVLDILFVAVIPMGVGGAAFATVLAQLISGAACLVYAWKILPMLRFQRAKMRLNRFIGKQMLVYGLPAALQMSIISISDMTLQAVVNTYGTTPGCGLRRLRKGGGSGYAGGRCPGDGAGHLYRAEYRRPEYSPDQSRIPHCVWHQRHRICDRIAHYLYPGAPDHAPVYR